MGLKVMKFHAVTHMIQDMLLYGVPTEFDTGSNESHHKEAKLAAKLTQRKESTFNQQTATRLTEFHCIDLGMQEIDHKQRPWEYFDGTVPAASVQNDRGELEMEEEQMETELGQELTKMGGAPLHQDPFSLPPLLQSQSSFSWGYVTDPKRGYSIEGVRGPKSAWTGCI